MQNETMRIQAGVKRLCSYELYKLRRRDRRRNRRKEVREYGRKGKRNGWEEGKEER